MGRPKALLPVGAGTLIEFVVERLAPSFGCVLVAARSEGQVPRSLRDRIVADRHPGAGPLAGIEAGLLASPHEAVVAVACDMPWLSGELAARMAAASRGHDAAVPRVDGVPQPTCAAYRRSAAPAVTAALELRELTARGVLERLDVRWLDGEDPDQLRSLNAPEEYQAFLDALRKTR
jgi:molybdopterin-guanine dinucleotide biosynthesis protein A